MENIPTTISAVSAIITIIMLIITTRLKAAVEHEYNAKLKALEHDYDQKLEAYRIELQRQSEIATVQLTKDLELKTSEYSIKLSEVFKKQTDVIAEVFRNLLIFRGATDSFRATSHLSDMHEKETALSSCLQALNTFNAHFIPNEIYIPSDTVEKINDFAKSLRDIFIKHHVIDKMETFPKPNAMTEQQRGERILKVYDEISAIEVQIAPLLTELKRDFQKILGIPIPDKTFLPL